MKSVAKYNGKEMLGINPGDIYLIDIRTYTTEHGAPYLWVQAGDDGEYLMPYISIQSLLRDWEITEVGDDELMQNELVSSWMDMYIPDAKAEAR